MEQAHQAAATAAQQDKMETPNRPEPEPSAPTPPRPVPTPRPDQSPAKFRVLALQSKHSTLLTALAALQNERTDLISHTTLPSGLSMPSTWTEEDKSKHALSSASSVIKDHIRLLHEYNEIKDIGQGLIGLVAEGRGLRVREVMGDFGVGEKD